MVNEKCKAKILVADDEESVRSILKKFFTGKNYDV